MRYSIATNIFILTEHVSCERNFNQDALEFWKHSDDMHELHGVLISAKRQELETWKLF